MSIFYNSNDSVEIMNPLEKDHIGIVTYNNDPLNVERVRIYVPGLLDVNNQLWFMKEKPTFPGVTYGVPKVGTKVRVWFKNNNIMEGYYGLDYSHVDDRTYNFTVGEHGFIDDDENLVKFNADGTKIETKTINAKANSITLDADNVTVSGSLTTGLGYTGSFATADGFTVTVLGGIITSIA